MPQFRKKPVVVEAIRIAEIFDTPPDKWPDWVNAGWKDNQLAFDLDSRIATITTINGDVRAQPEEWLMHGVNGELYPCAPDIFEKTYDPVMDGHGGEDVLPLELDDGSRFTCVSIAGGAASMDDIPDFLALSISRPGKPPVFARYHSEHSLEESRSFGLLYDLLDRITEILKGRSEKVMHSFHDLPDLIEELRKKAAWPSFEAHPEDEGADPICYKCGKRRGAHGSDRDHCPPADLIPSRELDREAMLLLEEMVEGILVARESPAPGDTVDAHEALVGSIRDASLLSSFVLAKQLERLGTKIQTSSMIAGLGNMLRPSMPPAGGMATLLSLLSRPDAPDPGRPGKKPAKKNGHGKKAAAKKRPRARA